MIAQQYRIAGVSIAVALAMTLSHAQKLESVLSYYCGKGHRKQAEKAAKMLSELSKEHGFKVKNTEDARDLSDGELAKHDVLVINNSGYWKPTNSQCNAIKKYIENGGSHVAWHMTGANHNVWAWFQDLVGTTNTVHSPIGNARIYIEEENKDHPILQGIPEEFTMRDEWYNFNPDPADDPDITMLLLLDEKTFSGGTMGAYHACAWCRESFEGGGRSYFHNMGHELANYDHEIFRKLVMNALRWAAGEFDAVGSKRPRWRPMSSDVRIHPGSTPLSSTIYRLDGSIVARYEGRLPPVGSRAVLPMQMYIARDDYLGTTQKTVIRIVR